MITSKQAKLSKEYQTVEELWKSIANLAFARVAYMTNEKYYPTETRIAQARTLKVLVDVLMATHEAMLDGSALVPDCDRA